MDSLSSFLVALISLIGVATSLNYLACAPLQRSMGFFTNLFMASMLMVVSCQNTFFFLIFWELMTLTSYFLVIWQNDKEENIKTGYIYLLVAHAGAALIMLVIFLFYYTTNSFDFSTIRLASLPQGLRSVLFILAFLGFGAKAGMVPLHFWTPDTYAAAPHHASALMSSVMKKMAIYGILRICIDLLGAPVWWWGFVILVFGAASTVIGAFYALPELNLKRLLAFSSVENVGIILMGIGLGVIGLSLQQPVLTSLGFLAALYHLLNHAFFKALLFLGAGAVIDQTGATNLNYMGGLARRMPRTALAFLIGALAVSAIPPLNGFVSEWFTYQAFFVASKSPLFAIRVFSPLIAILLSLAGAIALMVYIKAYGSAFAGPERNPSVADAQEAPGLAILSMAYLALGGIILGLGAPFISPRIAVIAARFANAPAISVAQGSMIFPAQVNQAVLSTPLVAMLLVGLLAIPIIIITVFGGLRAGKRGGAEPWSCGYGYSARMSITASSFYQPVKVNFQPLYWLRTIFDKPFRAIAGFAITARDRILRAEPIVEAVVTRPTASLIETAGQWIQALQMGDIRVYCLYIIVTLAILLIAIFGRSGL